MEADLPIEDRDSFSVRSMLDEDTGDRYVEESYLDYKLRLTPNEAAKRAAEIFRAAGISESCAGLIHILVFEGNKGFGNKPNKAAVKKAVSMVGFLIASMKPLEEGLHVGYGFKFMKQEVISVVEFTLGEEKHNLRIEDARNHAKYLFECAEAVQSDRFLHRFLVNHSDLEVEHVQRLLADFALFRQQELLEGLL